MIYVIICVTLLTWSSGLCEPPANSYLPPSNSGGRPSSEYGPPERNGVKHSGDNRSTQSGFRGQPRRDYLPPGQSDSTKLDDQYGATSAGYFGPGTPLELNGQGSQPRTPGISNKGNSPSSRLTDAHSSFPGSTRNSDFNDGSGPNSKYSSGSQKPESSYGPPSSGVQSSTDQIRSNGYSPNQQSYGYDSQNFAGQRGNEGSQASSSYESRSERTNSELGHLREAENNKPAKYEFSYDVDNSQTGTKFGHSEQRDGDLAIGEYNVVLPDGRKQVVEYEAGPDGFKPHIQYQGSPQNEHQGESSYSGSSNGLPGSNHGLSEELGQYQDASAFGQAGTGQLDGASGYPRGRDGQGNGYPTGGPNQGQISQGYPGSSNSLEGPARGNQGNSGCGNGDRGSPQAGGCFGSGRDSSGPKKGHDAGHGGKEGYPRGKPNGPLGTGY